MIEWKPSDFRKANPDLFAGAGTSGHMAAALAAALNPGRRGKSEWIRQMLDACAPDFADYEPGKSYLLTWNAETQKMEVKLVSPSTPATPPDTKGE